MLESIKMGVNEKEKKKYDSISKINHIFPISRNMECTLLFLSKYTYYLYEKKNQIFNLLKIFKKVKVMKIL